ncbi:MAG TPA: hypothetical protein VFJ25_04605 [Casimicrobiaceae bacterium]|nr:hypothetical protein [Casimicrobiaceae bacterium]
MSVGWWTAPSPDLELALDDQKRSYPLPLGTLEALDVQRRRDESGAEKMRSRYEDALTAVVKDEYYQSALELHSELEHEAESWVDRAAVRDAIAQKLLHEVYPWALRDRGFEAAKEYVLLAQKLQDARQAGVWGVDPLEDDAKTLWFGRAGLVKLCPDDARNEGQRVASMYGDRLDLADEAGYVLRYAVFSLPNFPQHHLAAGIAETKRRFREAITHAMLDGVAHERDRKGRPRTKVRLARNLQEQGRRFPDLVGAIACIESPLSGRYADDPSNAWNVHLNAILVFRPSADQPFGRPDYAPIREAWGADVHFSMIPQGDKDATRAAVRECVKYPLRAVTEKSEDHKPKRDRFGNLLTPAPAMVEWPPEFIDEWWRAFKRVRRTWSCGLVYSRRMRFDDELVIELPKPKRDNPDVWDYIGTMRLSPAGCTISPPRRDRREYEAVLRQKRRHHELRMWSDPAYAAAYAAQVERRRQWLDQQSRRERAARALFTLIQGNNSARTAPLPVKETLRAARGPPN